MLLSAVYILSCGSAAAEISVLKLFLPVSNGAVGEACAAVMGRNVLYAGIRDRLFPITFHYLFHRGIVCFHIVFVCIIFFAQRLGCKTAFGAVDAVVFIRAEPIEKIAFRDDVFMRQSECLKLTVTYPIADSVNSF